MRPLTPVVVSLLLLAACGESAVTIHGTLLPGSDATDVYVVGQPLRGRVEADSFSIAGITGEVVELEFADEGDGMGRMRIEGWSGKELGLRGIWLEDGVAHATALRGEAKATVNGLRMTGPAAMPRAVATEAVVLAVSGRGDALIVRPADASLPDLRVVVTPGTAVERADGEVDDLELRFGDSLRVEGSAEAGYVVATRVVVHARPAEEGSATPDDWEVLVPLDGGVLEDGEAEGDGDDRGPDEAKEEDRRGPRSLVRPGGGRGRGRGIQRRD